MFFTLKFFHLPIFLDEKCCTKRRRIGFGPQGVITLCPLITNHALVLYVQTAPEEDGEQDDPEHGPQEPRRRAVAAQPGAAQATPTQEATQQGDTENFYLVQIHTVL